MTENNWDIVFEKMAIKVIAFKKETLSHYFLRQIIPCGLPPKYPELKRKIIAAFKDRATLNQKSAVKNDE